MKLTNPMEFIKEAQRSGKAIASFNIHNLETLQAAAEAAAELNSPIILQTTPGTLKHAGIPYIAAIAKAAAEQLAVPIALHVDHCADVNTIIECINHGYTSVMIDTAHLPLKENIETVKRVVEYARARNVAVEGEIGRIGGVEDDLFTDEAHAAFTVPKEAEMFAAETGIDMLAVAVGTAHGEYKGEPNLDFARLKAIRDLVKIPLVLHGASGVPDGQIRQARTLGVCKVNIATEIKIGMARAIKDTFNANPKENDPRNYMGAAKKAIREIVKQKILLCGD
jgi:tagatose 1,6-diphosphate aldolase GatY/KbaY